MADTPISSLPAATTVDGTESVPVVQGGTTKKLASGVVLNRANHTGTQSADTVIDGTTNKAYTAAEKTKLAGVATGATANVVGAAGSGASNALSANDPTTTNARTPTAHVHPIADLSATGTRDATTFLRGDGTWSTTPAAAGAADASTTTKGLVQLTGDLAGTATAPTVPGLASKAALLTPTATKTAAYTAAVGDLAVMNVAGGATALTLPTAPADKAQVGFLAIGATTAVPLVVSRGGTDTLGSSGATSVTVPLSGEVTVYQYQAASTRWLPVANVKPLSQLDARYAATTRAFSVDAYGADPTGVADSTAAFNAAIAAMPTRTIFANPQTSAGGSTVLPVGALVLGAGTYKLGSGGTDVTNIGPLVSVIGLGSGVSKLAYYGSGDCLRMFNPLRPNSGTFDTIAAFASQINGLTIDGTNASTSANAGGFFATGLHYGDTEGGSLGPDLLIQNFTAPAPTAPTLSLGTTATSGGTFGAGAQFWKITARFGNGETQPSNEVTATLVATGTQVLNWTAVTNATGYVIYRGTSSNGQITQVAVLAAGTTTYTDTGTSPVTITAPLGGGAGSVGLRFENTVSWTENIYGRASIFNCTNAVVFDGTGGAATSSGGDVSFEYSDLTFKVYCLPNQNGVILRGGAWYNNGSLKIRANSANSATAQTSALLTLIGQANAGHNAAGAWSVFSNGHLEVQGEVNTPNIGGGANLPMTIRFGSRNSNPIYGTMGHLSFQQGTWTSTNWGGNKLNFQFLGTILGDPVLNPAGVSNPIGMGAQLKAIGATNNNWDGSISISTGDYQWYKLISNVTVTFPNNIAGPQEKVVRVQQAAAGNFTVTWPVNASPTTSSPTVKWPGGTAPTMTATANAYDLYVLRTYDGATWYGEAKQALA